MKPYQKQLVCLMWFVNLCLILTLAYVARTWLLASVLTEEPSAESRTVDSMRTAAGGQTLPAVDDVNTTLIMERNIFAENPEGDREALAFGTQGERAGNGSHRVGSQLGIRLLGTVAGDQTVSFAILEDSQTGLQDIYRIGDAVGEARLEEILPNRVVVTFEGERCTLAVAVAGGYASAHRAVARVVEPLAPVVGQGVGQHSPLAMSPLDDALNATSTDHSRARHLGQRKQDVAIVGDRLGLASLQTTAVPTSSAVGRSRLWDHGTKWWGASASSLTRGDTGSDLWFAGDRRQPGGAWSLFGESLYGGHGHLVAPFPRPDRSDAGWASGNTFPLLVSPFTDMKLDWTSRQWEQMLRTDSDDFLDLSENDFKRQRQLGTQETPDFFRSDPRPGTVSVRYRFE